MVSLQSLLLLFKAVYGFDIYDLGDGKVNICGDRHDYFVNERFFSNGIFCFEKLPYAVMLLFCIEYFLDFAVFLPLGR